MDKSNRDYDIDEFAAKLRSDGSYLNVYGETTWYNELGQLHREDGPAIKYDDGNVEWCLNNTIYSFNEWLKLSTISDEDKMILRLRYD